MRFAESQKGITLVGLLVALAILVPIVLIVIGALRRPQSLSRSSDHETAPPIPGRVTVARALSEPPAPGSPPRSSPGETSRPGMPADCIEMLNTLHDKVYAWARTTTDTDAIGDGGLCVDAKKYTVQVMEHCVGLHDFSNLDLWCESQSYVHPEVLLRRRERVRGCVELAQHRNAQLDAWRSSSSIPENASYKRRLCAEVKESTENFNGQCASVGGMTAQEVPAGWCESDSFDASSIRYIRRENR